MGLQTQKSASSSPVLISLLDDPGHWKLGRSGENALLLDSFMYMEVAHGLFLAECLSSDVLEQHTFNDIYLIVLEGNPLRIC